MNLQKTDLNNQCTFKYISNLHQTRIKVNEECMKNQIQINHESKE